MDNPTNQSGEYEQDEESYLRKQAEEIERMWLKKHAKRLGFKIPHPCTYNPANRSPNELAALAKCRQQRHDDAFEQYSQNPKRCLVCNEPIPYDRRHVYTCSEECERNNVTEEQYALAPKRCSVCSEVIPYTARKFNICNNCRTNNTKDAYEADPKYCKHCGAKIPYDNRKGVYCSKECMYADQATMRDDANARSHQAAVERYMANQHHCLNCGEPIPYEKRRSWLCCSACRFQYHSKQLSGRKISPLTEEERKARKKIYMHNLRATEEFKAKRREHDRNRYHNDPEFRRYKLDKNAEWNKAHPEAVIPYQKNYQATHKEEISAQRAQHYAENKLGISTCPNCGHDFLVTNRSTPLCQECVKAAYALGKNDSTYNPGKPYREILRKAGRLTPKYDNENYHVHHVDGIRDHDVNENLVILTKADHTRLHNLYRAELKKCMERGVMPPSLATFTWYVIREYNMEHN